MCGVGIATLGWDSVQHFQSSSFHKNVKQHKHPENIICTCQESGIFFVSMLWFGKDKV